ncbi:MAG: hypothetical protein F4X44_00345 [Gammaproteobacteria bacterium]|nr:hypothetical protein [Gammaproteobacteria bacterium]
MEPKELFEELLSSTKHATCLTEELIAESDENLLSGYGLSEEQAKTVQIIRDTLNEAVNTCKGLLGESKIEPIFAVINRNK